MNASNKIPGQIITKDTGKKIIAALPVCMSYLLVLREKKQEVKAEKKSLKINEFIQSSQAGVTC